LFFEFDEVKAQLWVKEDIVVTVICDFFLEEEILDPVINRD